MNKQVDLVGLCFKRHFSDHQTMQLINRKYAHLDEKYAYWPLRCTKAHTNKQVEYSPLSQIKMT